MEMPIRLARLVGTALAGAAAAMDTLAATAAPAAPSPTQMQTQTQTQLHALDGHSVTLDAYPAVAPPRVATVLSHGFTRS